MRFFKGMNVHWLLPLQKGNHSPWHQASASSKAFHAIQCPALSSASLTLFRETRRRLISQPAQHDHSSYSQQIPRSILNTRKRSRSPGESVSVKLAYRKSSSALWNRDETTLFTTDVSLLVLSRDGPAVRIHMKSWVIVYQLAVRMVAVIQENHKESERSNVTGK